jgi:hypothetical protein
MAKQVFKMVEGNKVKKQVISADGQSSCFVYTLNNDVEYSMPMPKPIDSDSASNMNGVLHFYAEAQDKGIDISPIISFFSSLKGINDAMYRHNEYKALIERYTPVLKDFASLPIKTMPLDKGYQFIDALHYINGVMRRAEIYFTGMLYGYHVPSTPDMLKALTQKQVSYAKYKASIEAEQAKVKASIEAEQAKVKAIVSPVSVKAKKGVTVSV